MQLSIGLYFTSFISIAVLRLGNLRGLFTLSLDCDGSEIVNCNSVVVDRYIVSSDITD